MSTDGVGEGQGFTDNPVVVIPLPERESPTGNIVCGINTEGRRACNHDSFPDGAIVYDTPLGAFRDGHTHFCSDPACQSVMCKQGFGSNVLVIRCPECGTDLDPDDARCPSCNRPVMTYG